MNDTQLFLQPQFVSHTEHNVHSMLNSFHVSARI